MRAQDWTASTLTLTHLIQSWRETVSETCSCSWTPVLDPRIGFFDKATGPVQPIIPDDSPGPRDVPCLYTFLDARMQSELPSSRAMADDPRADQHYLSSSSILLHPRLQHNNAPVYSNLSANKSVQRKAAPSFLSFRSHLPATTTNTLAPQQDTRHQSRASFSRSEKASPRLADPTTRPVSIASPGLQQDQFQPPRTRTPNTIAPASATVQHRWDIYRSCCLDGSHTDMLADPLLNHPPKNPPTTATSPSTPTFRAPCLPPPTAARGASTTPYPQSMRTTESHRMRNNVLYPRRAASRENSRTRSTANQ